MSISNVPLAGSVPGRYVTWLIVSSLVALLAIPGAARAQDETDSEAQDADDKPWFEGTDREQRKAAREIFREGNRLLRIPSFARAAEQYQAAIAIWAHPAFYYNLVIAQLSLVQPVEAYASVNQALRYGPEPLGDEKYQQALDYQQRLEAQLTRVVIRCNEPGAEVTLDGRLVFTGPGSHTEVLLPGSHQILARKQGRIPETKQVMLSAGEKTEITLILGIPDRIETERYVPRWMPWASLGLGAAMLASAGYLDWHSVEAFARHDEEFNTRCERGCNEDEVPDLATRLDGAQAEKRAAIGLYIAGGAMLVGSAVLVYVNRERVVRTKVERKAISWTPIVSPEAAGFSALMRF